MAKKAYPQNDNGLLTESPRNIAKWMNAMREVYAQVKIGFEMSQAFDVITANWDDMEKQDFKKWISFYQEGAHNKYKIAQLSSTHIENGGSFIPNIDQLRSGLTQRQPDMSQFVVQNDINDAREKALQKEHVDKKIQSLIGRLNSAEKIATNPHVQVALKKCLQMSVEEWVSLLQKLKREIQLAPMRSTSVTLIDDILYKNANQINSLGYKSAAKMMLKVAQGIPDMSGSPSPMTLGNTPMGGQPVGETDPGTSPGSLPGTPEPNDAVVDFLSNLNGDDISKSDDSTTLDELEVEDDFAEITVTAQAAPPLAAPPPVENPNANIEVSEDEVGLPEDVQDIPNAATSQTLSTGDPFDQALSNVKISDIVARLEGIASMFKNRQIARQLSIIDLMMDKTGIAPFFPTLAEAMRSALESNQYCQSRVEEILAKLRGTMVTPMSEHMQGEVSGENAETVKNQLAEQEVADKARKEHRKQMQAQEEAAEMTPQTPVGIANAPQELAEPAKVQSAPPLRPVG